MNSIASHENIRIKVVDFLHKIYREVVEELLRVNRSAEYLHLLRFLQKTEALTMLMPQEIYVALGDKKRIDMGFGGEIILEIKSSKSEFDDAYQYALENYINSPAASTAKFFIITDYESWRIYSIHRDGQTTSLNIIYDGPRPQAREVLRSQILPGVSHRIPPNPENIKTLFELDAEEYIGKIRDIFLKVRSDGRVKPLYKAYKQIMTLLYGEADEQFYINLFARHTYMQAIVLASLTRSLGATGSPEDVCGGVLIDVDVALPYLSWWRILYLDNQYLTMKRVFNEVLENITLKVNLINWGQSVTEDVFRSLYELLIDQETRRKIGEYYTPIWMVQLILNNLDIKGRIVLDPFCGSGTFLVEAFHKKIDEGEDYDDAYNSLVGYDINPLAVSIARAELIIAYNRRSGRTPGTAPHIYHIDTLAVWFEGSSPGVPEVEAFSRSARDYLSILINFKLVKMGGTKDVLRILSKIESSITSSIRYSLVSCKLDAECLAREIQRSMLSSLSIDENDFIKAFIEHVKDHKLAERLSKMIVKYGGNDVWGAVLTSVYAPILMTRIKPDVIVTNPPWIHITEFKAEYAERIRRTLRNSITSVSKSKSGQILAGSDVSTAILAKALSMAQHGVAFIMNREQLFYHRSPMPSGILATYSVVKRFKKGYLKLMDIDFDAFQHGIYPAIIITKEGSGEELSVIKLTEKYRGAYNKSLQLKEDMLYVEQFNKSYSEYVAPNIAYFSKDANSLAIGLDVSRVIPKGLYIMGIYGGEKKRDKVNYAGMILQKYRFTNNEFEFKLHNTSKVISVPKNWLERHGIKIYKLVYVGEINPFKLKRLPRILLSDLGAEEFKRFLDKTIVANRRRLSSTDIDNIRHLINEVKQPNTIGTLNTNRIYVIYRTDRAFTACTLEPGEDTVLHSTCSAIECSNRDQAYYYTAILNYLAYKVIERRRIFIHHQYARPVFAIILAGLDWKNMKLSDERRSEIISLSRRLSSTIPVKKFRNQKAAILDLLNYREFVKLTRIIDEVVNNHMLEEALNMVSGSRNK